jgi:hypothetical protein
MKVIARSYPLTMVNSLNSYRMDAVVKALRY